MNTIKDIKGRWLLWFKLKMFANWYEKRAI